MTSDAIGDERDLITRLEQIDAEVAPIYANAVMRWAAAVLSNAAGLEAKTSRYHFTDDKPIYVKDADGAWHHIGAGWLAITEGEYAALAAPVDHPEVVGVKIKPLEWQEPTSRTNGCWVAESILGTFSVAFDDGWHAGLDDGLRWEWEPELDPRSYHGPWPAQKACQDFLEAKLRSALQASDSPALEAGVAEALRRATILVRLLTVRQVIEAGDQAIEAAGLNPWGLDNIVDEAHFAAREATR